MIKSCRYQKVNLSGENQIPPRPLDPLTTSSNGFTLVELLIAVLISSILIIQIYNFFDYQQRNYALQDQLVEVQQNLRVATDTLSRDLRTAGYGVPSAATPNAIVKIISATEKSITFLANLSDVHTELASDYTSGGTTISVNLRDGFKNNKTIYITDGNTWDEATTSISGELEEPGPLTITPVVTNPSHIYPAGSTVHVVNTVTYTIDTTDKELTRDMNDGSGAQPICNNIDYLHFKYYDGSNNILTNPSPYTGVSLSSSQKSSVRKISILLIGKITRQEKGHTESGTYENGTSYSDGYHRTKLQTDIMLRNLAY